LVAFDSTHFKSQDEIVTFHQPLFDKWLGGTRLVGNVERVRFLSPQASESNQMPLDWDLRQGRCWD
jgi:hypothetical protein